MTEVWDTIEAAWSQTWHGASTSHSQHQAHAASRARSAELPRQAAVFFKSRRGASLTLPVPGRGSRSSEAGSAFSQPKRSRFFGLLKPVPSSSDLYNPDDGEQVPQLQPQKSDAGDVVYAPHDPDTRQPRRSGSTDHWPAAPRLSHAEYDDDVGSVLEPLEDGAHLVYLRESMDLSTSAGQSSAPRDISSPAKVPLYGVPRCLLLLSPPAAIATKRPTHVDASDDNPQASAEVSEGLDGASTSREVAAQQAAPDAELEGALPVISEEAAHERAQPTHAASPQAAAPAGSTRDSACAGSLAVGSTAHLSDSGFGEPEAKPAEVPSALDSSTAADLDNNHVAETAAPNEPFSARDASRRLSASGSIKRLTPITPTFAPFTPGVVQCSSDMDDEETHWLATPPDNTEAATSTGSNTVGSRTTSAGSEHTSGSFGGVRTSVEAVEAAGACSQPSDTASPLQPDASLLQPDTPTAVSARSNSTVSRDVSVEALLVCLGGEADATAVAAAPAPAAVVADADHVETADPALGVPRQEDSASAQADVSREPSQQAMDATAAPSKAADVATPASAADAAPVECEAAEVQQQVVGAARNGALLPAFETAAAAAVVADEALPSEEVAAEETGVQQAAALPTAESTAAALGNSQPYSTPATIGVAVEAATQTASELAPAATTVLLEAAGAEAASLQRNTAVQHVMEPAKHGAFPSAPERPAAAVENPLPLGAIAAQATGTQTEPAVADVQPVDALRTAESVAAAVVDAQPNSTSASAGEAAEAVAAADVRSYSTPATVAEAAEPATQAAPVLAPAAATVVPEVARGAAIAASLRLSNTAVHLVIVSELPAASKMAGQTAEASAAAVLLDRVPSVNANTGKNSNQTSEFSVVGAHSADCLPGHVVDTARPAAATAPAKAVAPRGGRGGTWDDLQGDDASIKHAECKSNGNSAGSSPAANGRRHRSPSLPRERADVDTQHDRTSLAPAVVASAADAAAAYKMPADAAAKGSTSGAHEPAPSNGVVQHVSTSAASRLRVGHLQRVGVWQSWKVQTPQQFNKPQDQAPPQQPQHQLLEPSRQRHSLPSPPPHQPSVRSRPQQPQQPLPPPLLHQHQDRHNEQQAQFRRSWTAQQELQDDDIDAWALAMSMSGAMPDDDVSSVGDQATRRPPQPAYRPREAAPPPPLQRHQDAIAGSDFAQRGLHAQRGASVSPPTPRMEPTAQQQQHAIAAAGAVGAAVSDTYPRPSSARSLPVLYTTPFEMVQQEYEHQQHQHQQEQQQAQKQAQKQAAKQQYEHQHQQQHRYRLASLGVDDAAAAAAVGRRSLSMTALRINVPTTPSTPMSVASAASPPAGQRRLSGGGSARGHQAPCTPLALLLQQPHDGLMPTTPATAWSHEPSSPAGPGRSNSLEHDRYSYISDVACHTPVSCSTPRLLPREDTAATSRRTPRLTPTLLARLPTGKRRVDLALAPAGSVGSTGTPATATASAAAPRVRVTAAALARVEAVQAGNQMATDVCLSLGPRAGSKRGRKKEGKGK